MISIMSQEYSSRYAITFGEVAILHTGGKEFGKGIRDSGFNCQELLLIHQKYPDITEYISISDNLPEKLKDDNEAGVLVFRSQNKQKTTNISLSLSSQEAEQLYDEQQTADYDHKYWDTRRSKTLNKRARYNVVFGKEAIQHSDDYQQCTVIPFSSLPQLNKLKLVDGIQYDLK